MWWLSATHRQGPDPVGPWSMCNELCFYCKSKEKQENGWADSHLQWPLWLFTDHRKTSPTYRNPLWVNCPPTPFLVSQASSGTQLRKYLFWVRRLELGAKRLPLLRKYFPAFLALVGLAWCPDWQRCPRLDLRISVLVNFYCQPCSWWVWT